MGRHIATHAKTGRAGVAVIAVAQDFQSVFTAHQREGSNWIP
jgi:hypothetical protein